MKRDSDYVENPDVVTHAMFHVHRTLAFPMVTRVVVRLARPLTFRGNLDSGFQTLQCNVINAGILTGKLPSELEAYRDWYVSDVTPQ